jgi:hypothetical protein
MYSAPDWYYLGAARNGGAGGMQVALVSAKHRVFGNGPYDGLVEQLKPVWPKVLTAAEVDVIVPTVFAASPKVQTVDVTEAILKEIGVDEKTRKIIDEMNQKIRSGEYDPAAFKGE